ncbi:MAG: ankyrin repeat domain-containing protein [Pyrinomonadaceae bacterium]|nr:ankyrin repeat domain-containing protein [Pyrinomonadaceae bacterium]
MKLRMTLFLFVLLVLPVAAPAQDSKQQLNDKLWEAARAGDAAAVTALLDKGADVNAKFRYGATALFKAAERGNVEVVKVLLARGADASVKDSFYGATAMTWALDGKHVEVVRVLLEKDATGVDDVLMTGVRAGNTALVEVALARGTAKAEALSAALVATQGDKEKAAIAELLKKAGAVPPPEVDTATLQSYVGKYRSEQPLEISVTFKDGKLFAAVATQAPLVLMALDKITFRPTAFDGLVITMNVEAGKVSGFTLKQGATTQIFKKLE